MKILLNKKRVIVCPKYIYIYILFASLMVAMMHQEKNDMCDEMSWKKDKVRDFLRT